MIKALCPHRHGGVSRWPALVIVALCLVAAARVDAQFGGGMRGLQDLNEPEYNARDIQTLQKVLQLDDGQRMLVEAFLEEYQAAFRSENEKYRLRQEEVRDSIREGGMEGRDWRDMIEPIRKATEEFRQTRDGLGQQFLADTQAILMPEQAEQWPQFELVMRRQKSIPRGMLSGESVDLFAVVEASILDEAQRLRIEPILNDYAAQLDSALQQREADMPRAEEEVVEAFRSGDLDSAAEAVDRQLRLRMRIRDINEQFARMIEAELTGPTTFREEYLKAAYPSVYGDDYYTQLFDAALALPDLDDTQRANVESLRQTFDQRMAAMNQDLARTVRENEPKRLEQMVEMVRSRMNGRGGDREGGWNMEDPIREGFNERREVSDQFRSQLEAILTQQQVESLPPPPRRPQRGEFGQFQGGRFQQADRINDDNDNDDDDDDDEDRGRPTTPPVDDRGFPPGLGGGGRGG
jgi:hypothetical protein